MDYEITIKVDTNDADYELAVKEITEEELNQLRPLIQAIKDFRPYYGLGQHKKYSHRYNYNIGYVRRDMGEKPPEEVYPQFSAELHTLFQDHCPYGENGFHSIISIEITPFVAKTKLL